MALKPSKSNSKIWLGIWREKGGWAWKVEDRDRWTIWGASGFASREAAKENMDECLKGLGIEQ